MPACVHKYSLRRRSKWSCCDAYQSGERAKKQATVSVHEAVAPGGEVGRRKQGNKGKRISGKEGRERERDGLVQTHGKKSGKLMTESGGLSEGKESALAFFSHLHSLPLFLFSAISDGGGERSD